MEFGKYSDRAKEVINGAQTLAINSNHQQLTPLHLLIIILEDKDGLGLKLIDAAGGHVPRAYEELSLALGKLPKVSGSGAKQV